MLVNVAISQKIHVFSQMEQINIVTMLIISVVFFLILLILGIRKSYKLKAENEKLSEKVTFSAENHGENYQDFREGHLYENK